MQFGQVLVYTIMGYYLFPHLSFPPFLSHSLFLPTLPLPLPFFLPSLPLSILSLLPADSVKEQLKHLKDGFNMLIPSQLLVSFTAKELEQTISGDHGMNIDVLQKRAKYMAGYSEGSKVIQWLWEVLGTYS